MSTQHIATAAFVKVSIGSPSGNRVGALVRRGDFLPLGVVPEQIERLLERDLIAAVEVPSAEEVAEELEAERIARQEAEGAAFTERVEEAARKLREAEKQQAPAAAPITPAKTPATKPASK